MYSRRVLATASRIACSIIPRSHSSKRGTAGNIGNPAASPEVQPAGRRAFESKSNFAPFDACQPLCVNFICHVSQNDPEPGATMIPWRFASVVVHIHLPLRETQTACALGPGFNRHVWRNRILPVRKRAAVEIGFVRVIQKRNRKPRLIVRHEHIIHFVKDT